MISNVLKSNTLSGNPVSTFIHIHTVILPFMSMKASRYLVKKKKNYSTNKVHQRRKVRLYQVNLALGKRLTDHYNKIRGNL